MIKFTYKKFYLDTCKFFVVSVLTVGLIVWIIQAVNYFDYVTEDGHGIKVYFFYSILNFPKIIHRILPFIFFISLFYILLSYELKNEISIFWINGISKINFAKHLILFSLIFMFFQIILGAYISPLSKYKARNYLKNSNVDFFTSLVREGKFINITKGLTIFIKDKTIDGTFVDIFLEETKSNGSQMIYAKKGILIDNKSNKLFELYDGQVINNDINNKLNIFSFDKINFNLNNLNSNTITTPKIQELNIIELFNCFFKLENVSKVSFVCNEDLYDEVIFELLKRIYNPVYIPLIALFLCFLLNTSKNEARYKTKVNCIFLIVLSIIVFSEVASRYTVSSDGLNLIFLITPLVVFLITFIIFYLTTRNV
jgi:lipopolysaccharide export system permease protein